LKLKCYCKGRGYGAELSTFFGELLAIFELTPVNNPPTSQTAITGILGGLFKHFSTMSPKKNKNKTNPSLTEEDYGGSDANSLASSTYDASPVLRAEDVDAGMASNMDVIQKLDGMRNDFASKIDVVLKAVHDVKRDVLTSRYTWMKQRCALVM